MGGKDTKTTRTMISNEINVVINTTNQTITKITNDTSTKIMTDTVNSAAASIKTVTFCENAIRAESITAIGSTVNIDQSCDMAAKNQATINIVMSAAAMADLASQIANSVKSQLGASAVTKADVENLAKIGKETSKIDGGGPEGMLDSIMDAVGGIGKTTEEATETEIRTVVNNFFNTINISDNDVKNKIDTAITNKITQNAAGVCDLDTTGSNKIDVKEILALEKAGKSGNINIKQALDFDSMNNCFITLNIGSAITNALTNNNTFGTLSETTSAADTAAKAANTSETIIKDSTESKSAIMNSVDNLVDTVGGIVTGGQMMIVAIVVGIVIVLVIGIIMMMPSGGSSDRGPPMRGPPGRGPPGRGPPGMGPPRRGPPPSDDDDEQDGGGTFDPCNLYLYGALFTTFLFVYSKSITSCGVMLALFLGFVIYSMNKNNNLLENKIL